MTSLRERGRVAIVNRDVEQLKEILSQATHTCSSLPAVKETFCWFHDLATTYKHDSLPNESDSYSAKHSITNFIDVKPHENNNLLSMPYYLDIEETHNYLPRKLLAYLSVDEKRRQFNERRRRIAYILSDFGEDVDCTDALGRTPLYIACINQDAHLCDVLLQCGADPTIPVYGRSIISHCAHFYCQETVHFETQEITQVIDEEESLTSSKVVLELVNFYWPGLWNAVGMESIEKVRKLINCWCKTDIRRNGQSLRELAVSTGNDTIISLILNIQPTMNFIYKCLASNLEAVKSLLSSDQVKNINFNLKKLSERSAPILYFLIRSGDVELLKLMVEKGVASSFAMMLDEEDDVDMPVLFEALKPEVDPEVVKILLVGNPEKKLFILDSVRYKGRNVLNEAICNGLADETILHIISVGGPTLLIDANEKKEFAGNITFKEKSDLSVLLYDLIREWTLHPDVYLGWREILILKRFHFLDRVPGYLHPGISPELSLSPFVKESLRCQELIDNLFEAVETDNTKTFIQLCDFHSDYFHPLDIFYHGRSAENVLPLLHWIVLHGRTDILAFVLESIFEGFTFNGTFLSKNLSLDNIRDPWRRTALHYAYGMQHGQQMAKLLSINGATDHTLDMYNKEPLDFRDLSGHESMKHLLENIVNKNFTIKQDEPWQPDTFNHYQETKRKQRFRDSMKHQPHHFHTHSVQHCHHQPSYQFGQAVGNRDGTQTEKVLYNQIYPKAFAQQNPTFDSLKAFDVHRDGALIHMTSQRYYQSIASGSHYQNNASGSPTQTNPYKFCCVM